MTTSENDLQYLIALSLLNGIGTHTAKKLLERFDSAKAVFEEQEKHKGNSSDTPPSLRDRFQVFNALEQAEKELKFIEQGNITVYYYKDKNYPYRLEQCPDAPILLYGKGNIQLNKLKMVSVIGSRNYTPYGKQLCKNLIEDLKPHHPTIISGLAYGIDIEAHQQALKNNLPTVAVLAHGLDRIYPSSHRGIAEQMLDKGGLITEFLSGTKPDKQNFPKRNRIVAGLSDAVVIVESALKGGSIITADLANSYARDVFAFPGKVTDPFSEGCNHLIKTNRAALIQNAKDMEYLLGWDQIAVKNTQVPLFPELEENEEEVVKLLSLEKELQIDQLATRLKTNISQIATLLLTMEFKGVVSALPGKKYRLNL